MRLPLSIYRSVAPIKLPRSSANLPQDPDSLQNTYPSFLLRLNNDEDINLNFSLVVRQGQSADSQQTPTDSVINGLTFVFAPSSKDVDVLVTREFSADPNFHKNPNVELVRNELSTGGVASVQLEYSWKWRPPKLAEDRGGGWRSVCAFVEYDQRAHKLNTLASFTFWVQNTHSFPSTMAASPNQEMLGLPRIRVASSQSAYSAITDSETTIDRDLPSPVVEMDTSAPIHISPQIRLLMLLANVRGRT